MEDLSELSKNPEVAADLAVNCVHHYLTGCGLVDKKERRVWLNGVCQAALAREDRAN